LDGVRTLAVLACVRCATDTIGAADRAVGLCGAFTTRYRITTVNGALVAVVTAIGLETQAIARLAKVQSSTDIFVIAGNIVVLVRPDVGT
jgi:hypothetical protein